PVYYTADRGTHFYWVSRPESRHAGNIAVRPEVGIVIYDSQVPVGRAEAVYLAAHAELVGEADIERCAAIFRGTLPDLAAFVPERLRAPHPLRLYRAEIRDASV